MYILVIIIRYCVALREDKNHHNWWKSVKVVIGYTTRVTLLDVIT